MEKKLNFLNFIFLCILLNIHFGCGPSSNYTGRENISISGLGPTPVSIGSAGNYVLFSNRGITNLNPSSISGDVGVSPGLENTISGFNFTADDGFSTSTQVNGRIFAADYAAPTPSLLNTANTDMNNAYNNLAARQNPTSTDLGNGLINNIVIAPGLYKWTTNLDLNGDISLTGGANDVWIFQIDGNLITANNSRIILAGAQARNIFWQVDGEATFLSLAIFSGIILTQGNITFNSGSRLRGRAFSQNVISIDNTTINQP